MFHFRAQILRMMLSDQDELQKYVDLSSDKVSRQILRLFNDFVNRKRKNGGLKMLKAMEMWK